MCSEYNVKIIHTLYSYRSDVRFYDCVQIYCLCILGNKYKFYEECISTINKIMFYAC